jgi:hypothetical protein
MAPPNFQHLQLVVPLGNKSLFENAPLREVETMAKDNLQEKRPLNHKLISLCLHICVMCKLMAAGVAGAGCQGGSTAATHAAVP